MLHPYPLIRNYFKPSNTNTNSDANYVPSNLSMVPLKPPKLIVIPFDTKA